MCLLQNLTFNNAIYEQFSSSITNLNLLKLEFNIGNGTNPTKEYLYLDNLIQSNNRVVVVVAAVTVLEY